MTKMIDLFVFDYKPPDYFMVRGWHNPGEFVIEVQRLAAIYTKINTHYPQYIWSEHTYVKWSKDREEYINCAANHQGAIPVTLGRIKF
jgi:hypothetical protein